MVVAEGLSAQTIVFFFSSVAARRRARHSPRLGLFIPLQAKKKKRSLIQTLRLVRPSQTNKSAALSSCRPSFTHAHKKINQTGRPPPKAARTRRQLASWRPFDACATWRGATKSQISRRLLWPCRWPCGTWSWQSFWPVCVKAKVSEDEEDDDEDDDDDDDDE